jgi:hypothetical protein
MINRTVGVEKGVRQSTRSKDVERHHPIFAPMMAAMRSETFPFSPYSQPHHILCLHIRSLGYQQLNAGALSSPTRPHQSIPVVLNQTQREREVEQKSTTSKDYWPHEDCYAFVNLPIQNTLPLSHHISRLYIRSLGYQQLSDGGVSPPTCPHQRRSVGLNQIQLKVRSGS